MEQQASQFIVATRAALSQASALVVEYAFSAVGAVLLLVAGWIIAGLVHRWAEAGLMKVRGFDLTLAAFLSNVVRYALLILVFIMVLGQFGVQTASVIAALGAAGLAIGLALQGTLQNIAAGIMLLVLRPFRVGEYIDTGSISGTIREIGLFATEMKTPDGMYRLAPNSTLWNVPITNYSREPTRRYDLVVGIGYEDDITQAEEIMMEIARAEKRVLADPEPGTFVSELGDSAVAITLRYWTMSPDFWPVSREFTKKVKIAFDEAGISIPFPQVTYSGELAAKLEPKRPVPKDDDKPTLIDA
ncbi:mechanosensitive ion channel family protein [Rhizobium halophytocola]|uniref:Small-conductance mechanosensitive channel n=1 Tax=Rhizobium halophytocola TaxID=735519 RepID=A0ABS4DYR1_9HYPH|nr:mechanosensitive ion channel domain-containing protein [Rhizobium halophytocola]MBP1850821.1 small conductance mechanosensitive channel [Rhizobium halophytocola]